MALRRRLYALTGEGVTAGDGNRLEVLTGWRLTANIPDPPNLVSGWCRGEARDGSP